MKRGRKRKYCVECHNADQHFDSNGLCIPCKQKKLDFGYVEKKVIDSEPIADMYRLWKKRTHGLVDPKAHNWNVPKHNKWTKELNVYERLEILEKLCKCIPKLQKEVDKLRKQVYGN